jgi:BMFP domain-containing protein YqiC
MTLEEKIRDLETQLENEKFFSRQDIMEVRGKNYVLLKECLQLLSDALDALEIIQENPEKFDDNLSGFLSTAIERIKSVMQDIEKNCKAHLERIDLNK